MLRHLKRRISPLHRRRQLVQVQDAQEFSFQSMITMMVPHTIDWASTILSMPTTKKSIISAHASRYLDSELQLSGEAELQQSGLIHTSLLSCVKRLKHGLRKLENLDSVGATHG